MDEYIVKNFPKTEDAVLVQKWISLPLERRADGYQAGNQFVERMVLETIPNWQERVLAEAKRLEAEAESKKKKKD